MKAVNIISFAVPFPANYGGVIDVYYKLLYLKKAGIKIHLHCFNYGHKLSEQLEVLCEKVYYYERKTGWLSHLSLLPYTVKSRQSVQLEKNLLANNFPILFEVLHTCYILKDKRFKDRKKLYRHSNIEHEYYQELSRSERNPLKKIYLRIEAWKLKRFERIVNFSDVILAVNQKDANYFKNNYPKIKTVYLPSFHENENVNIEPGQGNYILFHGNLSVSENYHAALWLLENVFSSINFKVIIAGLKPPPFLSAFVKQHHHIELIPSPDEIQMNKLIHGAQIHILYTSQPTGLKLKLLNVLFKGRFIICNNHMISGTGLRQNNALIIADSPDQFINNINACYKREFSKTDIEQRELLVADFANSSNTLKLLEEIF